VANCKDEQMKTVLFVLFITIYSQVIFAQQAAGKAETVDSLFSLVERITPSKQTKGFAKLTFNDSDLEKAKEYLYSCYAHNEVELLKRIDNLSIEWDNKVRSGKEPNLEAPAVRLKRVKIALEDKYGKDFVGFLETPYFLKVKIVDKTYCSYNVDKDRGVSLTEVVLKAEVLEVIKGKETFTAGQIISFSYLPIWFRYIPHEVNFNSGDIYLIPLRHWSPSGKRNPLLFTLKTNNINAIYKAEGKDIISVLEPGKQIKAGYEAFKNEFKSKYLLDK
jgi:hypothetical protein